MSSGLKGGFTIAVLALALVVGGLGAGMAITKSGATTTTVTTTSVSVNSTASGPYVLTLVIATNSIFNVSAADQPAYFVLGPHGLESSASIALPAHRLIKLVIVNYDDGNASLNQAGANIVSGTADGSVFVTSGAHNPTNTIMAVALRNMRHLAGN